MRYYNYAFCLCSTSDDFSKEKVVLTGFRSIKIEEFITSHKGKIMASVSGNTTLAIRKDNEESTKVQKAIQLGITILNLSVFESMHILKQMNSDTPRIQMLLPEAKLPCI